MDYFSCIFIAEYITIWIVHCVLAGSYLVPWWGKSLGNFFANIEFSYKVKWVYQHFYHEISWYCICHFKKCRLIVKKCSRSLIYLGLMSHSFKTLRPRQSGRHFPDDIFKCIFFNENGRIFIEISLKFVPKVPINNIPALGQIMAWRRPGNKPLSEPLSCIIL